MHYKGQFVFLNVIMVILINLVFAKVNKYFLFKKFVILHAKRVLLLKIIARVVFLD